MDYKVNNGTHDLVEIISKFYKQIDEFKLILNKHEVHEKQDIHPFLEKHKFILHPNPVEVSL